MLFGIPVGNRRVEEPHTFVLAKGVTGIPMDERIDRGRLPEDVLYDLPARFREFVERCKSLVPRERQPLLIRFPRGIQEVYQLLVLFGVEWVDIVLVHRGFERIDVPIVVLAVVAGEVTGSKYALLGDRPGLLVVSYV